MAADVVREFGGIRVDTVLWPIILIDYPPARVPDSDFFQALGQVEQVMHTAIAQHQKTYVVTDITRVRELPPASQRKYAADFVRRTAHVSKAATLGTANVTPSSILRGILTAVYWVSPSPTPTVFLATRREAYTYAIRVLEAAGVTLAPPVRALGKPAEEKQASAPSSR
jgi:hypothetical protein